MSGNHSQVECVVSIFAQPCHASVGSAAVHDSGRPPQGGPDPRVLQPSTGALGRLGCPLAKTSSQPLAAVSRWRRRRRIMVGWVVRRPAMAMDGKRRKLAEEEGQQEEKEKE